MKSLIKGQNIVVTDNANVDINKVIAFLSKEHGYKISYGEFVEFFSDVGKFNIIYACVNGVYYNNFSTFLYPLVPEKLFYTKTIRVNNVEVEGTVYFDVVDNVVTYLSKFNTKYETNWFEKIPVILKASDYYKVSDVTILESGVNYCVSDIITFATYSLEVTSINKVGGINTVALLDEELASPNNYAGEYSIIDGSGYGAKIKVRTHYIYTNDLSTGSLAYTCKSDPLTQKSYVDYVTDNLAHIDTKYSNDRVHTKSGLIAHKDRMELAYKEYNDSVEAVEIFDGGLVFDKYGAYIRVGSRTSKLQTRDDVVDLIAASSTGSYKGKVAIFGNLADMPTDADNYTTALTKDTYEYGVYSNGQWSFGVIEIANGDYYDVVDFLDAPGSGGIIRYCDGNWIPVLSGKGNPDFITLSETEDGSLCIKTNEDGSMYHFDASHIRLNKYQQETIGSKINDICTDIDTKYNELYGSKISKVENTSDDSIAIFESDGIKDSKINIDKVLTTDKIQVVTAPKTFDADASFLRKVTFDGDVLIGTAVPYTTENKPAASDIGAVTDIKIGGEQCVKTDTVVDIDVDIVKSVLGLGDAAYCSKDIFATSEQGAKADAAFILPTEGILYEHLSEHLKQLLSKADTALQKVSMATELSAGIVKYGQNGVARYGYPGDVGLDKVPNVDCTDANSIISGILPKRRLPDDFIVVKEGLKIRRDEAGTFVLRLTKNSPYEKDVVGLSDEDWITSDNDVKGAYMHIISARIHNCGTRPLVQFYEAGDNVVYNHNIDFVTGDIRIYTNEIKSVKILVR